MDSPKDGRPDFGLNSFPNYILLTILSHLSRRDRLSASLVSKRFLMIAPALTMSSGSSPQMQSNFNTSNFSLNSALPSPSLPSTPTTSLSPSSTSTLSSILPSPLSSKEIERAQAKYQSFYPPGFIYCDGVRFAPDPDRPLKLKVTSLQPMRHELVEPRRLSPSHPAYDGGKGVGMFAKVDIPIVGGIFPLFSFIAHSIVILNGLPNQFTSLPLLLIIQLGHSHL